MIARQEGKELGGVSCMRASKLFKKKGDHKQQGGDIVVTSEDDTIMKHIRSGMVLRGKKGPKNFTSQWMIIRQRPPGGGSLLNAARPRNK